MGHETITLTREEFKRIKRDLRSLEKRVSNTEIRRRSNRRAAGGGGGDAFRWARTPIGGIPAATFDPTGGSDSLGLMTAGQATCPILETNDDVGNTYEIRTGNEEVIYNGVRSVIGGETIIGISRHRDGRWFVIVEDCLSGEQPILTEPPQTSSPVSGLPTTDTTLVGDADSLYFVDDDASP